MEVKRDVAGRAVGLGAKLERGSGPSMCGGKRRGVPLLSRLRGSHAGVTAVFCFASNPPPLPKRKEAKFGPQVSSVVLKMYLWVVID